MFIFCHVKENNIYVQFSYRMSLQIGLEAENKELQIKPLDNQLKRHPDIHPALPQPSFVILAIAPRGSGKTTAMVRMLIGNKKCKQPTAAGKNFHKFYRHVFSRIFIISPTWKNDKKTGACRIPDAQVFDGDLEKEDYEQILSEIIAGQEEDLEDTGEAEPVLIVFSDCAGTGLFNQRRGSAMNRIVFNGRHLNISVLADTQSLRQVNNAMRENVSAVMLFGGIRANKLEAKKCAAEYLGRYNEAEVQQIFDYVYSDSRFNFLYVNMQQQGKLYKNFQPLRISSVA